MLGRPVDVKAYTFRRSRSVHLLGHGISTPEDLRFMLAHKNIETTRKYIAGTGRDLSNFAGELKVEDGVIALLRKRLERYYAEWRSDEVKCLAARVESAKGSDAFSLESVQAILGDVPPFIRKHFGLKDTGDDMRVTLRKVEHALKFMNRFWEFMESDLMASPAAAQQTPRIRTTFGPSTTTHRKASRSKCAVDNERPPSMWVSIKRGKVSSPQ